MAVDRLAVVAAKGAASAAELAERYGVSQQRIRQIWSRASEDVRLEALGLSRRAANVLAKPLGSISAISPAAVSALGYQTLRREWGCGKVTLAELCHWLDTHGHAFPDGPNPRR